MPVNLLLVEGELDSQLLSPILSGRPAVEATKFFIFDSYFLI